MCSVTTRTTLNDRDLSNNSLRHPVQWFGKASKIKIGGGVSPHSIAIVETVAHAVIEE